MINSLPYKLGRVGFTVKGEGISEDLWLKTFNQVKDILDIDRESVLLYLGCGNDLFSIGNLMLRKLLLITRSPLFMELCEY